MAGKSVPLGCASWSFAVLSLNQALDVIHTLGFSFVDIGFDHLDLTRSISPLKDGKHLGRHLSRRGMAVADLFPALPYETNDPSLQHQADNRGVFAKVVEFAAGCKARGVTVKPGVPQDKAEDSGRQMSIDVLSDYVSLARRYEIRLSIEPHVESITEAPQSAKALVESVPGLEVTLDYSHFVSLDYEIGEVACLLTSVRHFHVRQACPGKLQARNCEGTIPFPEILTDLLRNNYGGILTLEYQNSDWHGCNNVDVIAETMSTVRCLSSLM